MNVDRAPDLVMRHYLQWMHQHWVESSAASPRGTATREASEHAMPSWRYRRRQLVYLSAAVAPSGAVAAEVPTAPVRMCSL